MVSVSSKRPGKHSVEAGQEASEETAMGSREFWHARGVPTPGSYHAIQLGCSCEAVSNAYGHGIYTIGPKGVVYVFKVQTGCKVHGGQG
jgi:hypothetical protein